MALSATCQHASSRNIVSCSSMNSRSARDHGVLLRGGSPFIRGSPQLRTIPRQQSRSARGTMRVEANLFGRIARVVRSYTNALVTKAEDPEKILEQAVIDMQGDLIKMRQASAQVVASQKQLELKYKQAQQTADDWYRRAELALAKGEEELAREALKRRKAYGDNATQMKVQLEQQKKATDTLIGNTRVLEQKLTEAKSKKDTLKARAKSAEASRQITEMIQGLNTSNAVTAFERMEEKVMALEAESEATLQLAAPDSIEDKFAALEGDSVDDELSQMKRSMLSGGRSKAALPEGRPFDEAFTPTKDAIDVELDALRRRARD